MERVAGGVVVAGDWLGRFQRSWRTWILMQGEHTRSIAVATPSKAVGGIMKFAKVTLTCLNCKCPLPNGTAGVPWCARNRVCPRSVGQKGPRQQRNETNPVQAKSLKDSPTHGPVAHQEESTLNSILCAG